MTQKHMNLGGMHSFKTEGMYTAVTTVVNNLVQGLSECLSRYTARSPHHPD